MKLYVIGNGFRYELENICRLFFPFEKIEVSGSLEAVQEDFFAVAESEGTVLSVRLKKGEFDRSDRRDVGEQPDDEIERLLAVMLYELMCLCTGMRPQWGILTGVRPGKLMRRMVAQMGEEGARKYFSEKLLCSEKKIDLCLRAAENEEKIIASS